MKIYTSYFGMLNKLERAGIEPVAICRGKPKWFNGNKFYQSLDGAMRAVYEMMLMDGDECADLGQAVSTCKEIKSEITRVAREVAANVH